MEAIHLETGQRISHRVVQPWGMFCSEGKVMYQGQNGNGSDTEHILFWLCIVIFLFSFIDVISVNTVNAHKTEKRVQSR